eukprot:3242963-Pleurochrysis_carterae.AAC.2
MGWREDDPRKFFSAPAERNKRYIADAIVEMLRRAHRKTLVSVALSSSIPPSLTHSRPTLPPCRARSSTPFSLFLYPSLSLALSLSLTHTSTLSHTLFSPSLLTVLCDFTCS